MRYQCSFGVVLCSLIGFATSAAHGQHMDVYVNFDGGVITTGGVDVDDLSITPGQRVFEGELGEFPAPPGFGDEPGFFADSLTPGTAIGFDIVDGLRTWNGSDFDTLASESMTLSKGVDFVVAPNSAGGFASGFEIAAADGSGGFDDHPEYELAPGSNTGIFLLTLTLWTDAPGIGDSAPIWIVFNNGLDEAYHEAAVAWVEANLVPAPGLGVLGFATFALLRRRR